MCKFETVYLIYKSMSSVLTPQVFLKPQTSPPPSVPSVIMVFSPQRWGSSLLQVSNSCTHGFYPLSCILSSQVLTRTKVRILQLKMLLIPQWPVFTIATYDFHWPSLKNMSFPTCRIQFEDLQKHHGLTLDILTRKKYDVWRWGHKSKHSSMKSSTKPQSGFYGQQLQNGVKTLLPISIIWSPEPGWMPNFECNLFESFARSCYLFFQQPC